MASSELKSASKMFLFAINLVTFILGLVLVLLGAYLQIQFDFYVAFLDDAFYSLASWCITMGVIVCVVSFLGEVLLQ